jgi:hypothetical protein
MVTAVHDWPAYLAEIFRVTAPGGHVQLSEMTMGFTSESKTLGNDAALKVMERVLQKNAVYNRYDHDVGSKLLRLAEKAGFHSLEQQVIQVPCGTWQSGHFPCGNC